MGPKLLIFIVFAFALSAIGAVGFYRSKHQNNAVELPSVRPEIVRTEALKMRKIPVTATFYGRIEATSSLDMAFNIPGRLKVIGPDAKTVLKENDVVRKGEQIAMLDLERYEALQAKAKAYWERASAEQASAQAGVDKAQAELDDAKKEFDHQRKLLLRKATDQRSVDRAETRHKFARAEMKAAQAASAQAAAVYTASGADLREAEFNYKEAKLFSPIDGIVAAIPVEVGTALQPSQVVMRLIDVKKVNLVIGVVERKLPRIREGQSVLVDVLALDAVAKATKGVAAKAPSLKGFVRVVPPAADPATNLFNVEVEIDNRDGLLKPGMIGKATIEIHSDVEAIAIPVAVVNQRGSRGVVYFVREGLPVGLDMGDLGAAKLSVSTPIVQEVIFDLEKTPLVGDYYLLADAPKGLSQLVIEGQSRVSNGNPVRVVTGAAPSMEPEFGDSDLPSPKRSTPNVSSPVAGKSESNAATLPDASDSNLGLGRERSRNASVPVD
jgi:HlyD family secretion protein